MTWIQTIKLGKVKVIDRLNRIGISFSPKLNYFKLCSLLYQYLKSIANWLVVLQVTGEPLGLTAELQNRYERKATIHNRNGSRIGRLWFQQGVISYDKASWSQWRVGQAATYSEALATIAG